jgi:lantibiotic biosynthesis protein
LSNLHGDHQIRNQVHSGESTDTDSTLRSALQKWYKAANASTSARKAAVDTDQRYLRIAYYCLLFIEHNMQYVFSKELILRMPVRKPGDYAGDDQSFLDDPFFRAALYLASPAFFRILENQSFESGKFTEKEKTTLRKYINRYCFRPTPFGLFAAVSLGQWTTEHQPREMISRVFKASFQIDQAYQAALAQDLLDHELSEHATFTANPSIYRVLDEYRFYRTALDESGSKREYLLESIDFSRLLKGLFRWSDDGWTLNEIIPYIVRSVGCTITEAADYAGFLINAQVLVNCLRPNICGRDYLERLAGQQRLVSPSRIPLLVELLGKIGKQTVIDADVIRKLDHGFTTLLPKKSSGRQNEQIGVILQQATDDTGVSIRYQELLRDGIYALNALSPADRLPGMENFIRSYQQYFEGQTVPLLVALDPEAGIGYQQAGPEKNNPLLETLHIPYKMKSGTGMEWTAAQGLLLKGWLRSNQLGVSVIELTEEELRSLKLPAEQQLLGMSVLFRLIGDAVFIESAGGSNAPALMGRFTAINGAISEAAKNMARLIEQQNPQVIFAELLHLSDPHTDNINRRDNIYTYELPIAAASDLTKEFQLALSDLYIRIEDHKVVLFSRKHGKVVIPRLSSAYNHHLNKLPLFRFLADLPYQYGRSNLNLDLRQYFPGQSFYPRIVYRKAILCLATWIITGTTLEALQQQDPVQMLHAFKRLSGKIHLAPVFSLSQGDQELVFNQENDTEILLFCSCIRQKQEVIVKEFLPQADIRQYNAYLLPKEPLVLPLTANVSAFRSIRSKRKYLPGSEWLYLKVYAPRIGAEHLMLRLRPLLRKRYLNGPISKWFFIRYEDHAPHIRLRMKVAPEDISEVLIAFKAKLEDRIQQHVIREYQVEVYSRELERYAAAGIEKTEDLFWASSELVLSYLNQNRYHRTSTIHQFALYTTQIMVNEFIVSQNDQLVFLLQSYQQFLPEFAEGKVKIELDKKYRELSATIRKTLTANDPGLLSGSAKAGEQFMRISKEVQQNTSCGNEETVHYLRSIIHMHLNRIFTDESRKQEMIVYYLLYKHLLAEKGKNRPKKA